MKDKLKENETKIEMFEINMTELNGLLESMKEEKRGLSYDLKIQDEKTGKIMAENSTRLAEVGRLREGAKFIVLHKGK